MALDCLSEHHTPQVPGDSALGRQTAVMIWAETNFPVEPASHMQVDGLSMLMTVIAAFVGGLICIYAVGYMKAYHHHHTEYRNRTGFFLSMLFLFLGAMFGLVLSGNLVWMYFFWEITSVISFLLIGYTRTEEAVQNSFRALWMNLWAAWALLSRLPFRRQRCGTVQLEEVVRIGAPIPIALLALAGLTKSAQLPFSSWLARRDGGSHAVKRSAAQRHDGQGGRVSADPPFPRNGRERWAARWFP